MGLKNGIVLKTLKTNPPTNIPSTVHFFVSEDTIYDYFEFWNWRKCWGLRNSVVDVLNNAYNWPIEIDDIDSIITNISSWDNKEKWESKGPSIWSYENIKPHLDEHIFNLKWLKEYLSENPNAICCFYDSY